MGCPSGSMMTPVSHANFLGLVAFGGGDVVDAA